MSPSSHVDGPSCRSQESEKPGRLSHRARDRQRSPASFEFRPRADETAVAATVHERQFPQVDRHDEPADVEAHPHRTGSARAVQFASDANRTDVMLDDDLRCEPFVGGYIAAAVVTAGG